MQYRIFEKGKLLDRFGETIERGYSTRPLRTYSRKDIKRHRSKVRESDSYYIIGEEYALYFCISDYSTTGFAEMALIELKQPLCHTIKRTKPFTMGGLNLDSEQCRFKADGFELKFTTESDQRTIYCKADDLNGMPFECEFIIETPPMDSITLIAPFKKRRRFIYTHRQPCLKASGSMTFMEEGKVFEDGEMFARTSYMRGCFGGLQHSIEAFALSEVDGALCGFNFAMGQGDLREANENALFAGSKISKLDEVKLDIPRLKFWRTVYFMSRWRLKSPDHRLDVVFKPIINCRTKSKSIFNFGQFNLIAGRFDGSFITDDGALVSLDNMSGFILHKRFFHA